MKTLLRWLARTIVPTAWLKRKITETVTAFLERVVTLAEKAGASTTVTDIDDKAASWLRQTLLAPGVIASYVEYVWSLIFGTEPPAPVDPEKPLPPPPAPAADDPGIFRRIGRRLLKLW